MTPQVAMGVQFFTNRTLSQDRTRRLPVPEPIGPLPALIAKVHNPVKLDLVVFLPTGRSYIATDVTTEPTTKVQHYWRLIPQEDEHGHG